MFLFHLCNLSKWHSHFSGCSGQTRQLSLTLTPFSHITRLGLSRWFNLHNISRNVLFVLSFFDLFHHYGPGPTPLTGFHTWPFTVYLWHNRTILLKPVTLGHSSAKTPSGAFYHTLRKPCCKTFCNLHSFICFRAPVFPWTWQAYFSYPMRLLFRVTLILDVVHVLVCITVFTSHFGS